jgi:hypothetical protein
MAVNDLGMVRPGQKIILPFHTFDSNDPSASVTLTGLALADIGIYKSDSMTERASTAGVVLLDTDGIDIDTTTGIHGISIDLADNTTAGFYSCGSKYYVTVASVTVDGATVNFVLGTFEIGYPQAFVNTTIATLASQTSFTLTTGSADDDAYNGWTATIHDVASEIQVAVGAVLDYTGGTKTVTLVGDPGIFTMAATDNISLTPPSGLNAVAVDNVWDEPFAGHTGAGAIGRLIWLGSAVLAETTIDTFVDVSNFGLVAGSTVDDFYNDMEVLFLDGACAGVSRIVLDYVGATKDVVLDEPLPIAPANGDAIIVKSRHTHPITQIAAQVAAFALSGETTAGSWSKAIQDIEADTNEIQASLADGGFTDLLINAIQADLDIITGADGVIIQTDGIDAVALDGAGLAEINTAVVGTALTESYAADGATASAAQLLYMIWAYIHDFAITSATPAATKTSRNLAGTAAMTHTIDDETAPTDVTRAT